MRQPNPFGICRIDFSSPVANCGLPFTIHTAWWRWSTSTRGTVPFEVDELGVEPRDVPGLLREEVGGVEPDDVLPGLHGHRAVAVGQMLDAVDSPHAGSRPACPGSVGHAAALAFGDANNSAPTAHRSPIPQALNPGTPGILRKAGEGPPRRSRSPLPHIHALPDTWPAYHRDRVRLVLGAGADEFRRGPASVRAQCVRTYGPQGVVPSSPCRVLPFSSL